MGDSVERPKSEDILALRPEQVPQYLPGIPKEVAGLRLPALPESVRWQDLKISVRTKKRVTRLAGTPQDLAKISLADLSKITGFGKGSLFDLLKAFRSVLRRAPDAEQPQAQHDPCSADEQESVSTEAAPWDVLRLAKQIHEAPGARLARSDDPRFGALVRSIDPEARNAHEAAGNVIKLYTKSLGLPSCERNLSALHRMMLESTQTTLESELADLLGIKATGRNRDLVARYLGWDGRGTATLDVVGRDYGLTRERVRQISDRVLQGFSASRAFAPVLDQVLLFIAKEAPAFAFDVERDLQRAKLTAHRFRLDGVIRAAELLNRRLAFSLEEAGRARIVVTGRSSGVCKRVLRVARRQVRLWGASTLPEVSAELAVRATSSGTEALVAPILKCQKDFRWLDEQSGWFWLASVPRNRILRRIRKVLAVVGRLPITELRRAISRDPRLQGFSPPKRVLLSLCEQQEWCKVETSDVFTPSPIDPGKILSRSERTIVDILHRDGPVMLRTQLEELCAAAGLGRPVFWSRVSGSPVFARYAPGVYGLAGASIEPGVIEALTASRRRPSRVLADYGWLPDGDIWLAYKLSEGMVRNGAFSVPAGMARFLEGERAFAAQDGSRVGTLKVAGNAGWGLGPFYRRRGGEPGDYLVIRFHMSSHAATVFLGNEELLDEYQSSPGP